MDNIPYLVLVKRQSSQGIQARIYLSREKLKNDIYGNIFDGCDIRILCDCDFDTSIDDHAHISQGLNKLRLEILSGDL